MHQNYHYPICNYIPPINRQGYLVHTEFDCLPSPPKKTVSRVDGEGAEEVGWDLDQHRQDKVDVDVAAELGRHHADAVVDQGDYEPDDMQESDKCRSKVDTVVSSKDRGRDFQILSTACFETYLLCIQLCWYITVNIVKKYSLA